MSFVKKKAHSNLKSVPPDTLEMPCHDDTLSGHNSNVVISSFETASNKVSMFHKIHMWLYLMCHHLVKVMPKVFMKCDYSDYNTLIKGKYDTISVYLSYLNNSNCVQSSLLTRIFDWTYLKYPLFRITDDLWVVSTGNYAEAVSMSSRHDVATFFLNVWLFYNLMIEKQKLIWKNRILPWTQRPAIPGSL